METQFTSIYQIFLAYLNLLYGLFLFDVKVYSTPMNYYLVFPALFYTIFFCFKWTVLTLPVWMSVYMAVQGFKVLIVDVISEIRKPKKPD